MSLKRKAESASSEKAAAKKPRADFFLPKSSTNATAASLSPPRFIFPIKGEGNIRMTTWNVNGIKSVDEKEYLQAEDPDILILTETKHAKGRPDIMCLKTRYKYQTWGTDPKPSQAGTAILSKQKPLNVVIGLPTWPDPQEETAGRYVQLEFEHWYLAGTYVPNSGVDLRSMPVKKKWNAAFMKHVRALDSVKPVIWAGDFNCIPTLKDVDKDAGRLWDCMGGLTEVERTDFDAIIHPEEDEAKALVDAWRYLHPDAKEFTHATFKFGAWRLDSFILSSRIIANVQRCEIRHELKDLKLSDHWPVTIDLALAS
ncbi:DNase I-like protein [Artomyces pyxidatus]|uniref:DNase I-like protein n=1 Tax=Artomyces pyxidatus TaxID=48021 RepID=A0ACB8TH99_9AGAM|nr:DNase I-like protein [Artomyces pyxidatus]